MISLELRCINISHTWSRCFIFMSNVYMIINVSNSADEMQTAACRCVASPVGGAQSPNSPLTSGMCSSKRSHLESGLLAWQPRGGESVCVRDGGAANGRPYSAQTADEEKDIWQVQVSASLTHTHWQTRQTHTHIQRRAGGGPLWGSPWPVILSCVYLPREPTHAPRRVQAGGGDRAPLYTDSRRKHTTQHHAIACTHIHTAY